MKRLITYLIVIALTFYTAVLYGSTSFLMLFYVELALPFFLMLTLLPAMRSLRLTMELPIPVVEQGQKVPVLLRVRNGSFPIGGRIAVPGERNAADGTENRENLVLFTSDGQQKGSRYQDRISCPLRR